MKKIKYRSYFAYLIAFAIFLGVGIYLVRYFTSGKDWAMLRANSSVYSNGVMSVGAVEDRNGVTLAEAGNGTRSYADDATVRKSCFHVVGDYEGNIGTGALSLFDEKLAGYDPVNGITSLTGAGKTVKLSIDSALNAVAYNAMGNRKGAVLVSNYKTGEILCMVSTPSYDPNSDVDLTNPAYEGLFINRTFGATYTPGSVFKLITLTAAIETIPDLDTQTFTCGGAVTVGGDKVTCTGTHGNQDINAALAHSCNCAFSEIAQQLGTETLAKYAKQLGITQSFSLNGAETKAGNFESAAAGSSNLSWSAIGQYTDLVSPFAMLRVVSGIANGGVVEEPTILLKGKTSQTQIMKQTTADKIAGMMANNVASAYGQSRFPDLSICAKTGTAEVGDGTSNSWFVGFLNDEAHPYAFAIAIERGGGGLANAGVLANTVLQAAVSK